MKSCEQTTGQNILEHGQSVWKNTKKLIIGEFEDFKLPNWFRENHHFIVNNLWSWDTIKRYNIYHDIGKPYCFPVTIFSHFLV